MVLDTLEAIAGGLLIFVLPGLAWSRAIFPEWRIRGPLAITRAVETAALALLLSVAFTIVVGFGLTFSPSGPFPAAWSNPVLEAALSGLTVAGAVVGFVRGGFARTPPVAPPLEPAPGADSPMEFLRELEELRHQHRRLQHDLRRGDLDERTRESKSMELRALELRAEALTHAREEELAG